MNDREVSKLHLPVDDRSNGQLHRRYADMRPQNVDAEELASQILRLARNTLMIDLRFLEVAFVRLRSGSLPGCSDMATDGRFLYYEPVKVCRQFQQEKSLPVRNCLHIVLHCVFRHLFVGKDVDHALWDLSCDIAVENVINSLNLRAVTSRRQTDQEWILKELHDNIPHLSAEWIYKYFRDQDISEADIEHLRKNFYADDHSCWYMNETKSSGSEDPEETAAGDPGSGGDDDWQDADQNDEGNSEHTDKEGSEEKELLIEMNSAEGGDSPGSGNSDEEHGKNQAPALKKEELERIWKDISERIELDLDTISKSWGEGAGDMIQTLKQINREKFDYAGLLKRFAVTGEAMQVNDDEFDYIYYTYGLELYHDTPMVEPLEYKEVKKIREFVIALDTSESVSGDLVQTFVTKTWNILKQTENFFTRINVHIIQCGARIEEDIRITGQDEFDQYIKDMVLKGFGGTDFRPVFEHVDELIRQREFHNLKGMIYFTDGYGTFPVSAPAYDTCFVFLDQGYELPEVPPWVIRIVLNEEEICAMDS